MDLEAPVDAWYVWLGVAVASLAITGVVLSLPSQPPPDATGAANTIDRTAGSSHFASAASDHDADEVRIDAGRLSMRNDGGTAHASVAFESLTPLSAVADGTKREALSEVVAGTHPSTVLDDPAFDSLNESDLRRATDRARLTRLDNEPEWREATGTLQVARVQLDGETVVLVEM